MAWQRAGRVGPDRSIWVSMRRRPRRDPDPGHTPHPDQPRDRPSIPTRTSLCASGGQPGRRARLVAGRRARLVADRRARPGRRPYPPLARCDPRDSRAATAVPGGGHVPGTRVRACEGRRTPSGSASSTSRWSCRTSSRRANRARTARPRHRMRSSRGWPSSTAGRTGAADRSSGHCLACQLRAGCPPSACPSRCPVVDPPLRRWRLRSGGLRPRPIQARSHAQTSASAPTRTAPMSTDRPDPAKQVAPGCRRPAEWRRPGPGQRPTGDAGHVLTGRSRMPCPRPAAHRPPGSRGNVAALPRRQHRGDWSWRAVYMPA